MEKKLSCGEISAFYTEFEQFMEFYQSLCRFCSKSMWRKICAEKIFVEKKWHLTFFARAARLTSEEAAAHTRDMGKSWSHVKCSIQWNHCEKLGNVSIWQWPGLSTSGMIKGEWDLNPIRQGGRHLAQEQKKDAAHQVAQISPTVSTRDMANLVNIQCLPNLLCCYMSTHTSDHHHCLVNSYKVS